MIIYNVTIKVDFSIQTDWLNWMQEKQIPAILDTGCFTQAHILQLLEPNDPDGVTYAVQYYAESKELYNQYIQLSSRALSQKSFNKWGDKLIEFPTVMQLLIKCAK
ncbi:MAG: DUF4286 family protein [Ferruginibacter sp.]